MVIHNMKGGQKPPFKIKPSFSILIPTPLPLPKKNNNWANGCVREVARFQNRQMANRQTTDTHKEIKLLWVCKLLCMPQGELLQYKKVVIHLLTSLLEVVNFTQSLITQSGFTSEKKAATIFKKRLTLKEETKCSCGSGGLWITKCK